MTTARSSRISRTGVGVIEIAGEAAVCDRRGALFFPEMAPYVGRCRFGLDCAHDDEPGCAVRKAVVAGAIRPRRYQSYMRLKQED